MSNLKVKTGKRNTSISRSVVRKAVKAHVNTAKSKSTPSNKAKSSKDS